MKIYNVTMQVAVRDDYNFNQVEEAIEEAITQTYTGIEEVNFLVATLDSSSDDD